METKENELILEVVDLEIETMMVQGAMQGVVKRLLKCTAVAPIGPHLLHTPTTLRFSTLGGNGKAFVCEVRGVHIMRVVYLKERPGYMGINTIDGEYFTPAAPARILQS